LARLPHELDLKHYSSNATSKQSHKFIRQQGTSAPPVSSGGDAFVAALHSTWKTAIICSQDSRHLLPAVLALHLSASNWCRDWFTRSAARCFAEDKQIHEKAIGEPSCSR